MESEGTEALRRNSDHVTLSSLYTFWTTWSYTRKHGNALRIFFCSFCVCPKTIVWFIYLLDVVQLCCSLLALRKKRTAPVFKSAFPSEATSLLFFFIVKMFLVLGFWRLTCDCFVNCLKHSENCHLINLFLKNYSLTFYFQWKYIVHGTSYGNDPQVSYWLRETSWIRETRSSLETILPFHSLHENSVLQIIVKCDFCLQQPFHSPKLEDF